MKITVTQEHIDKGGKMMPHCCPIALAVYDQLDDVSEYNVCVVPLYVRLTNKKGKRTFYFLPSTAKEFINNFDYECEVVKPVTFIAHEGENEVEC